MTSTTHDSTSREDLDGIINALRDAIDEGDYDIAQIYSIICRWPSQVPPGCLDRYRTANLVGAGDLCLQDSCARGDLDRVKSLLSTWQSGVWGAHPTPKELVPALVAAAESGHALVVSYLLDRGAEVLPTVPALTTNAAANVDLVPVFQAYIDHGWDINSKSHKGEPMLNYIADRESLIRYFLDNGANPSGISERSGSSPLDAAASYGTTAVVALLLERGAKLEDSYPLHQAVVRSGPAKESITMIDYLLDLGVDILDGLSGSSPSVPDSLGD
ncbi:MAG: hypothetical protein M1839_004892 [Geoglossum umbratile]|nr:MAG: hypothetical protein M1839_004892 [Geoglossum umbratile]